MRLGALPDSVPCAGALTMEKESESPSTSLPESVIEVETSSSATTLWLPTCGASLMLAMVS